MRYDPYLYAGFGAGMPQQYYDNKIATVGTVKSYAQN